METLKDDLVKNEKEVKEVIETIKKIDEPGKNITNDNTTEIINSTLNSNITINQTEITNTTIQTNTTTNSTENIEQKQNKTTTPSTPRTATSDGGNSIFKMLADKSILILYF